MLLPPKLAFPALAALAALAVGVGAQQVQLTDSGAPGSSGVPVDGGGPLDLTLPTPVPEPVGTPTPAAPATSSGEGAVPAVEVFAGVGDIPGNVLAAYQAAADAINRTDPSCHLPWTVLAGIGKVESGHARGGSLDAHGRTTSPILGPVLSGGPGIAAIRDSDGGQYDGDATWDRAVGPMQFIPSSWRAHAVDGNGDGQSDPSNIYDATLGSAGYLCTGDRDLSTSADLKAAIYGYNHSWDYVTTVLAWAAAYDTGAVVVPAVHLTGDGGGGPFAGGASAAEGAKHAGGTAGNGTRADAPDGTTTGVPTTSPPTSASETPGTVSGADPVATAADIPLVAAGPSDPGPSTSPDPSPSSGGSGSSDPTPPPKSPDPTPPPKSPDPTPSSPDPTPSSPDPTPSSPDPTPSSPDPTPSSPDPTPTTDPPPSTSADPAPASCPTAAAASDVPADPPPDPGATTSPDPCAAVPPDPAPAP